MIRQLRNLNETPVGEEKVDDDRSGELNAGSLWYRWEPHVHAPGTLLNNQFGGSDPWSAYLDKLEKATPTIRAIAVTAITSLTHTNAF